MHKLTKEELPAIAPLFEGVQETMVWSCLQGLMGEAYAAEETPPACAQLLLGDFCFFGGDARAAGAAELAGHIPRWLLAVPPDAAWEALIEQRNPGRFERVERYAFEKEPSAFDRAYLARLAAVPAGYQELPIGRELYEPRDRRLYVGHRRERSVRAFGRQCEGICGQARLVGGRAQGAGRAVLYLSFTGRSGGRAHRLCGVR